VGAANAWLALAGGIVVVVGGVVALIRWLRHHLGGLADFINDWHGEPARPGVQPRPGVMERLAGIENRLTDVEHELKPNSGKSLRDAVNRVDARTARIAPDPE
jgi:hypothetical protein